MTSADVSHRDAGTTPQRLGLLAHGFASWGGGIDFLRLTASSLRYADPKLELHVLAPVRGPLVILRNLRDWIRNTLGMGATVATRPTLADLERALSGTGAILHLIDLGPRALARATEKLRLDAVLPAMVPQPTNNPPWVGYLYDFQHKHLPQFFSPEECARRDVAFGRMLDCAPAVIVNAQSVVRDIERFFPNHRARVFVLPFSPAPGSGAFSVNVDDACRRHGVCRPYFIICNQFWKHKDHGTAFKAFATLVQQHPGLSLVCTGATGDHRFPGHFEELMREARLDGVADRIHSLGLIPKLDQLALMRGAIALIQPTLFEGGPGGGAVYDAVGLGQRSIVSDIPVNTEIDDPMVTFFKVGDAESLTAAMEASLATFNGQLAPLDQAILIARGIDRRRTCGKILLRVVAEVLPFKPTVVSTP